MFKALQLICAIMMAALPGMSYSQEFKKITLENKENIRYLKNNISDWFSKSTATGFTSFKLT